jgi:hypothetical protein
MYTSDEQLFDIIGRIRERKHGSRSAAAIKIETLCQYTVGRNPSRIKSKAASAVGVPRVNKAKVIYDFLNSKLY